MIKKKGTTILALLTFLSLSSASAKTHEFKDSVFKTKTFVTEFGGKNKESMLLVHGLGNQAAGDWDDVIPVLSESYHLIRVELPGFGRSEKSPSEFYTPENYAKFLYQVVKKFAVNTKVIIVGHSLGGAISLSYVSLFPETVRKLILIDTAGILQRSVFTRSLAHLKKKTDSSLLSSVYNKTIGIVNGFSSAVLDFADRFSAIQDILMSSGELRSFLAKDQTVVRAAMALIETNYADVLSKIKVPTLILWGKEDPVAPLRTGLVLEKKIQNSKLIVYPKARHVPMKDSATLVARDINKWLSSSERTVPVESVFKSAEVKTKETLKKYTCENKEGLSVSGNYSEMSFNNCQNILLENVKATHLKMRESYIKAVNLKVRTAKKFAIDMEESILQATNLSVDSKNIFKLDSSKLDLAGADLFYRDKLFKVDGKSIVWWSVSRSRREFSAPVSHHKTNTYR